MPRSTMLQVDKVGTVEVKAPGALRAVRKNGEVPVAKAPRDVNPPINERRNAETLLLPEFEMYTKAPLGSTATPTGRLPALTGAPNGLSSPPPPMLKTKTLLALDPLSTVIRN